MRGTVAGEGLGTVVGGWRGCDRVRQDVTEKVNGCRAGDDLCRVGGDGRRDEESVKKTDFGSWQSVDDTSGAVEQRSGTGLGGGQSDRGARAGDGVDFDEGEWGRLASLDVGCAGQAEILAHLVWTVDSS